LLPWTGQHLTPDEAHRTPVKVLLIAGVVSCIAGLKVVS
jgi:hypothetical protein